MLYKVVIICITAVAGASPTRLEPQFDAENEEELREKKLPEWLGYTGYTQVEGTDIEVSEVKPDPLPEPEPSRATPLEAADPPAPPTSTVSVDSADIGKNPEPASVLVIGESKNADGAIYLGHDAQGNEVWDLPESPSDEAPTSKDGEASTQS